nr:hypothetical protein [Tanacetum cinerariifolium]
MYIAVPAEILGIILPLLLGVAFLVLAERKVMAFVQRRKGPDVVGSFGLLQPLADGFKLIIKEPISPSSANFSFFRMAPVATFIQGLPNDIYSLIDSNDTAKDLWDALERQMRGSEYGEQDTKPVILYEYETYKATEGELLLDTYLCYLQAIDDLKKCVYKKDNYYKKAKVKDYNYYMTKMLVAKKDSDEQVLLDEDQAWMESSSDSDQEISANMVFMAKIEKVLSDSEESLSSAEETIVEVSYYTSNSESESEYETLECYDNSTNYGLFLNNDDDQEIFHDAIESASENFNENHIVSQIDHDESEVDRNNSEEKDHVVDKLTKKFNQKNAKCQKRIEKTNEQSKDLENQNKDLQDKYDVLQNQFRHLSSVRRPKHSGFIWKKEGSSNTSNVDLSSVSHSKLNKDVKRYSRKDLLSCNNSHHVDTRSAYDCNDAMNVSCNSRLYASCDVNDLFVFDDICVWIIDSGCSKHMTGNRALLTNFVEKFLGTVHLRNNNFAVIAGYGDVVIGSMTIKKDYYVEDLGHNLCSVGQLCDKGLEVAFRKSTYFVRNEDGVDLLTGDRSSNLYTIALNEIASNSLNCLPKMKFKKNHLCSACEQKKIHRKYHKSKTAFASNKPRYLLHVDLCGPMRIESINEKRYVLVVVDDYSWYTWVFFLHSKDEAFEAIISFIKKTQVNLQLQQNGVVERRNRSLVEAARTMLTFANLSLLFWAEAIVTACFTQNHSIIHKCFDKTLSRLINKRKPNIKFFHVFGCRCYLLNDFDDVGKLKAKRDIRVFVRYSKESAAFRVYRKCTRKIHESVNVNFDEISEMASKQFRLEPGLSNSNEMGKSLNPMISQVLEISNKDLEDLFYNFYDEYFDSLKIMKSPTQMLKLPTTKFLRTKKFFMRVQNHFRRNLLHLD